MANLPDPSVERLATFDDPPLPPGLWPRVARARRRQLLVRRAVLGGGFAALCVLLVLPGRLPGPDRQPDGGGASRFAAIDATPAAGSVPDAAAVRLRILDRELQDAYRRRSDEAGIAELWAARAALLREGTATVPVRPVRI